MRVVALFALLLLFPISEAFAANPTGIAPDSGTEPGDYTFQLLTPDTYIDFAENFYADELEIHGDHVMFENIALGAASNPTQTFGLASETGNITVTEIASGYVKITMECSGDCNAFYYYPAGVEVYEVETTIAGALAEITEGNYHRDQTEFDSATGPAAFENSQYVEVKVTYENPTTITFYVRPVTSGGGGGGSAPPVTTPPSSGATGPLNVTLPAFEAKPGEPVTQNLIVKWTGSYTATLTKIEFKQHPEWFTIGQNLPFTSGVSIEPGQVTSTNVIFTVPITLTVEECVSQDIDVEVTATNGISSSTARVTAQIHCGQEIEMWMIFAGAGAGIVGVAIVVKRRR